MFFRGWSNGRRRKPQLLFQAGLRIRMLAIFARGPELNDFAHLPRGPFYRLLLSAIFFATIGIGIIHANHDLFGSLLTMRNDYGHDTAIVTGFDG